MGSHQRQTIRAKSKGFMMRYPLEPKIPVTTRGLITSLVGNLNLNLPFAPLSDRFPDLFSCWKKPWDRSRCLRILREQDKSIPKAPGSPKLRMEHGTYRGYAFRFGDEFDTPQSWGPVSNVTIDAYKFEKEVPKKTEPTRLSKETVISVCSSVFGLLVCTS